MSRARDLAGIFNLNPLSGTTAQRPTTAEVGDIYYNGTIGKTQIYTTTGWQDMASGIPYGNTAGRPAATVGQPYFNGETQRLELYTGPIYGWQNIVAETPGVTGYTGTISGTSGGTIVVTGTNFASGASTTIIGSDGTEYVASSTTVNNLTQITAVFGPVSESIEPYDIRVTNPSNLYGVYYDILTVNDKPIWQTSAGLLGTFVEQSSVSVTVTAIDEENNTITYALAGGSSLPSGLTLNSSTGNISGTLPDISADTTYTFTINASDGINSVQPRTFSINSTSQLVAETLVIAGGGGGGSNGNTTGGGGGGAGGYLYSTSTVFNKSVPYTLTIGTGGTGRQQSTGSPSSGNRGGNSAISGSGLTTITAIGGGGGQSNQSGGVLADANGGSGGGSNYANVTGGTGTVGQGNNGGGTDTSGYNGFISGGGGSYAEVGKTNLQGGHGGAGTSNSITGTATLYAAGGGAGCRGGNTAGSGGSGIGGNGRSGAGNGFDASPANTGSGGGGGGGDGNNPGYIGGTGSNGVIVIAYPDSFPAASIGAGLTYDQPTRAGYRVYRFTAGTGTVTF